MAALVDEMVLKIRLDMSGVKPQAVAVESSIKNIREQTRIAGEDMVASGKKAAQFFSLAKVEALAFISIITGGSGLLAAISSTASSMAALGRSAANLNGMDPTVLDAWGQSLKRIGGDATNAVTSFNNVASALSRYKLMGDTKIIPFLNAIGGQTTMTPEQIALRFSAYIREHPEKSAQDINVISQGLGFTEDMTNLLKQGPDAVRKELALSRELGLRTVDMIKSATEFQHDFEALNQAARHLTDVIMSRMMPTADQWVKGLTAFIVDPEAVIKRILSSVREGASTATEIAGDTTRQEALLLQVGETISKGVVSALTSATVTDLLGVTPLTDAFHALGNAVQKVIAFFARFGLMTDPAAPVKKSDAATDDFPPRAGTAESVWQWLLTKAGLGTPERTSLPSAGAGPVAGPRVTPPDYARPYRPVDGSADRPGVPYTPGAILGQMGINAQEYGAFKSGVSSLENAAYTRMGGSSNRFAGRYQMGRQEITSTARRLGETSPTTEQFLNDPAMQERYFEAYTAGHHETLMRDSERYRAMSPQERLQVLGYAHNQGAGWGTGRIVGATKWLATGAIGRDGFGTSGTRYYNAVGARLQALPGPRRDEAPPASRAPVKPTPSRVRLIDEHQADEPLPTGPLLGPRAPVKTSPELLFPDLLQSPKDRTFAPSLGSGSTGSTSMNIGTINIQTQATDAGGIAKELHGAVTDRLIAQANRGLS